MNQGNQQMSPLTEKDLSYIKDMMSWELLAAKKAFQYAHQTMEPECKQAMQQAAQQHQGNYDQLMQHLGHHMQQAMQATMAGAQPASINM